MRPWIGINECLGLLSTTEDRHLYEKAVYKATWQTAVARLANLTECAGRVTQLNNKANVLKLTEPGKLHAMEDIGDASKG